jgi:GGDEF domain-containing protein
LVLSRGTAESERIAARAELEAQAIGPGRAAVGDGDSHKFAAMVIAEFQRPAATGREELAVGFLVDKILVGLALSQAKLGDTGGSVATMIELIRTFRGQPITRADYGPDAEQLYRRVHNLMRGTALGTDEERLRISAGIAELQHGDTAASIFERADGALYRAKDLGKDRADIAAAGELRPDPESRTE